MKKDKVIINGKSLSFDEVHRVAYGKANVHICPNAMQIVLEARRIVLEMLNKDIPVYGLNRGVGANKDRNIDASFYEEFNNNLIRSHCVGIGPEASEEVVRAAMLVRLNTLLLGYTGIQPEIVIMYKDFLNNRIHPMIPERGSVGEADIANLSYIGLAMIGEGEVHYKGEKLSAIEALRGAGLEPLKLGPKDGLAIVSSNALTAGKASLILKEALSVLEIAEVIYSLSLEGLNGNVSPLHEGAYKARPFPGQGKSAENVRNYLKDSFLWDTNFSKSLQDPLSFRGACQVHGSVRDALDYVTNYLHLQLNSSDDNPCLLIEEKRFVSCSNYEVLSWVLGFEMLGNALNHLAKISCFRIIKLGTASFTGLSRFLAPNDQTIAFGTIQKTVGALATEIRHLSNPSTSDYFSLAEDIEDHANNSMHVVTKTAKIIDNLYYILGIEAMHAAQAIDLRGEKRLGNGTKTAYDLIRSEIPFLDKDRPLLPDIQQAYTLLKSSRFFKEITDSLENVAVDHNG